jgi:signal transduction histidine kinase
LKTPLATLKLDLAHTSCDLDGALLGHLERMEGQIRHHLGRARAAEASRVTAPCPLKPRVHDLAAALTRIHGDRSINRAIQIEGSIEVYCDSQDLDEMLGNLLDNAWQHARTTVRVRASIVDRIVEIRIDDDGLGITPNRVAELNAGQRLDERAAGHGFGVSIARELAELHGGTLTLDESELGGVLAILCLPGRASIHEARTA